jgi:HPr kinase/phosphorylase
VKGIHVETLLADKGAELQLERLNQCSRSTAPITVSDVNRPGLCLAGFTQNFLYERIQILGETEILFLSTLPEESRNQSIERLLQYDLPVVIFTKSLPVPPHFLRVADERRIPVLRTPLSTTPFIHRITSYLDDVFAPQATIHGSFVDVYGVGMLITGRSGIGKSECALDLVERGHRLEIVLNEWASDVEYDRLGLEEELRSILGVKIPVVTVPINPGKNITVIAEVVALNHLLKEHGVHAAAELNRSLRDAMASKRRAAGRGTDGLD